MTHCSASLRCAIAKTLLRLVAAAIVFVAVSGVGAAQDEAAPQADASAPPELVGIHDPVMAKVGDTYYAFGTGRGVTVFASPDMVHWERRPAVFDSPPEWIGGLVPAFNRRGGLWAPDVYHHDGTFYLYYSASSFGRNNSAIGVATNTTLDSESPDYRWVDHGRVVNSVAGRDMWNAIDAHVTHDDEGTPWMSFGSHWGGIKLVKLTPDLLAVEQHPTERAWHTIAARHRYWKLDDRDAGDAANPELDYDAIYPADVTELNRDSESGAIEAPFIFKKGDYYYLFVSWDRCCRGAESTYKVVVGRAPEITGPYLDRADQKMIWGGGTLVVTNFNESQRWAAGGHNSVYTFDGVDYLVFHAYESAGRGSRLLIKPIDWDAQGWPTVTLDE
jgi:arabinan endo-1,5-alpha-L-arabinosidase